MMNVIVNPLTLHKIQALDTFFFNTKSTSIEQIDEFQ